MDSRIENKRYFGLLVAFFLIGSLSTVVFSMGKVKKDLSEIEPYNNQIKKIYITKKEFVIFKNSGSNKILLGEYGDILPEKKDIGNQFPYKWHGIKILGILPSASNIEINKVMLEGPKSFPFVAYYGELVSSKRTEFIGKQLRVSKLYESKDPPKHNTDLVEEIK